MEFVEYETLLESLRLKRRHRLLASLKAEAKARGEAENLVVWKGSISDHSIKQRIHSLYDRALRKFPGDVNLWMIYIEWCVSTEANKAAAKALGRAIQLHPSKSVFWILAAKHEYELSNISASRILLQRGLRVNPHDKLLWLEYFKLELAFVEKSRARRQVLFGKREKDMPVEEVNEENIVLDDVEQPDKDMFKADELTLSMIVPETNALQDEFFNGAIPKAIYRNAIKAIPNDFEFRREFLEIYIRFGIWTKSGQDEWFESLQDLPMAQARGMVAGRHIFGVSSVDPKFPQGLKACLHEFTGAVEEFKSVEMVSEFWSWLQTLDSVDEEHIRKALVLAEKKLFIQAKQLGVCSVELWLKFGNVESTKQGLKQYPDNLPLWKRLLELEPRRETFHAALKALPNHILDIWTGYWSWIVENDVESASEELKTALNVYFRNHSSRFQIFRLALNHLGPEGHEFAKEMLDRFRHEYQYYLTLVRWELGIDNLPVERNARHSAKVRKWLEQAVSCSPESVEPWIFYVAYELNAMEDTAASLELFARARNQTNEQEFLAAYNRLTSHTQ